MPSERIHIGEAKIVTMRDLSQRTAQIMSEIVDSGKPAVVTRHGRFIAVISPLSREKIESFVLSHLDEFVGMEEFDEDETEVDAVAGNRAAFEADVSLDEFARRQQTHEPGVILPE